MRIHIIQHEPFEGPGNILAWAQDRKATLTYTHLYEGGTFPSPQHFDLLVVMGGGMSVNDEVALPWLKAEKEFLRSVIKEKRKVIGICLGAQLLASALGAKVYKNKDKEIGWHDVKSCGQQSKSFFSGIFPDSFTTFHWHGETFDLPSGAEHLASSAACLHQAFGFDNHVLGLQFHLEATPASVEAMVLSCAEDMVEGEYIQKGDEIMQDSSHYNSGNAILHACLDRLTDN